jgi:hypothetical protein
MGFRGCRIAVSGVAVFLIFVAFALTLAAIFTPQWQVAGLEQVNQIRFIGLYQTCAYGSRQGPYSPPQWICTFIPYGRGYGAQASYALSGSPGGVIQPFIAGGNSENDYNAYGGESWRLATLVLLVMAALLGFIAFVAALIEICVDSARANRFLKGAACCSVITLTLATLCCMIGVLVFAVNMQQNHNLYILELTAFAIFQLGQSFYIGVAALILFLIALIVNIGGTALTCISAKSDEESGSYRQRRLKIIGKPDNEKRRDFEPNIRPPPPLKRLYDDSGPIERPKRLYEDSGDKNDLYKGSKTEGSNFNSPGDLSQKKEHETVHTSYTTWTVPTLVANQDRNTATAWRAEKETVHSSWAVMDMPSPNKHINGAESVASSRRSAYSTTAI